MSATVAHLPAATAPTSERASFVRRTYGHLAMAVLAFAGIESLLLRWDAARTIANRMTEGYNWLLVILAFSVVSTVADRWARAEGSIGRQYLGLAVAVLAQAALFLPLLLGVAARTEGPVVASAAVVTLMLVAGLTAVVVVTGRDFSMLRTGLTVVGFVALGLIVASILFGFSLGPLFSWAMVLFASGSILYNTGNVLHAYRTDQHVAAALSLFASVALLLWWVIRIMGANRR